MSTDAVVAVLRGAERITAFCHENPDADTLGSAIALRLAAERLGKVAEVVCADRPPAALEFLPRVDEVRTEPALEPDVAVVVDAGDLSRIGPLAETHAEWLSRATVLNIDHHVSNPRFGAAALVDPDAAATCEMVALLLPRLGVELDTEIATALLAGIVMDTHTFAHPNATPRTLRVAADLVAAGAPLHAINRAIYADKPFATLALWGMMLAGMEQRCDGRIVYAAMELDMLRETGADPAASEGFVDLLGATRAAQITVLFKEAEPARVRVSVRTREPADAVAITSAFGGGGHARAAGCTIEAPLAEAQDRLLAECERELRRLDAGRR
ncbi:MAG TPA: bifunctional oligoribonuclease/PAP phosphatase NrnA [Candidatus Limnocylindria bacterium]|nr:bifunctional oligoribonuclease/PAP phosphatase NrnA [Candidatus Limnocylindria bacterium]